MLTARGSSTSTQSSLYATLWISKFSRPSSADGFCADCGHQVPKRGGDQSGDRRDSQERCEKLLLCLFSFLTDNSAEEDSDPMAVPASLSDSSWYSPESPVSPTKVNSDGLELPSYDGFQPRPRVSDPDDLPNSLLGPSPSVASLPQPPKPRLPRISDPWSNYTPDPDEQATP